MDRVRCAAVAALVVTVAAGSVASAAGASGGQLPLAAVEWPTSTLLVSEVEPGGVSASDEFIELTNAGATAVDLAGLEVVYVTSSGSTVTRKAAWSSLLLEPGRHLLIANTAGVHAVMADATYAGGLASTGGVVVLRPIGGTPIDAVGWGDALNAFVEATAAAAPEGSSSIERLPGGSAGNGLDTNDNAADFTMQLIPSPQNLASPPTPDPLATPSPTPTGPPAPSPTPTPTAILFPTPSATPTRVPTASPSATPSATPGSTPVATPTPTPPPTPTPVATTIANARSRPVNSVVVVDGVVTAEAGRLGVAKVAAVQDATAGIAVRLPDAYASVKRGTRVRISGTTAAPYGQLEIRSITEVVVLGEASIPLPIDVSLGEVGEDVEGRLVASHGRIDSAVSRSASGDLSFDLVSDDGRARVVADSSSGLSKALFVRNATYDFVGVVGQRETSKGRNDGHRVWLRDVHDVKRVEDPPTSATPKPSSAPKPSATSKRSESGLLTIARALLTRDKAVRVEGRVTTPATLLDATGRRIVIEDATAAIEVYLPAGSDAPSVGATVHVDGKVVRAYGAPRLRARATSVGGAVPAIRALRLGAAPGAAHEWRLVTVSGVVTDVRRLGERWRAELLLESARVPIAGLPGSGVAATALSEGHRATVTGIVKRASPGATDRRFAIVPRSAADIDLGSAVTSAPAGPAAGGVSEKPARASTVPGAESAVDADIAELANHVGQVVRVGGLVVSLQQDGATLDDGTAVGRIVLRGPAADYLPLLEEGDAINATGTVNRQADELVVVVTDAAGIARVGDPTTADPSLPVPLPSRAPDADATLVATADPFGPLGIPGASLAMLILLSGSSVAVTVALRRGARRRAVAIAARLRGLPARARGACD